MEAVYNKTRTEEVSPEAQAAVAQACAVLGVTSFVADLDGDVCPDGGEFLGPDEGSRERVWFHCFCTLEESLVPTAVLPIRENFWSLMGRRVRPLSLSDSQERALLSWGADFRVALRAYRISDPQSAMHRRNRGAAAEAGVARRPRFSANRVLRTFVCGIVERNPG